jgi:hypothetical protein
MRSVKKEIIGRYFHQIEVNDKYCPRDGDYIDTVTLTPESLVRFLNEVYTELRLEEIEKFQDKKEMIYHGIKVKIAENLIL